MLVELKDKNQEIARLSTENYSMASELQEAVNDIKLLSDSYEIMKDENNRLKYNEKILYRQNNDVITDSKIMLEEYQKGVIMIEKMLKELHEERTGNS